MISVTNDSISITGDVKSQPLLVSGSGVGDVGAVVLAERQQLGRHGVVVINAQLQQKTLQIVGEPEITTKGFVYTKSSGELLSEIRDLVIQTISKRVKSSGDLGEIRKALEDKLSDFVHKQIGRDPMFIISLSKTESNRHRPETSIRSPRKSLHRDNQEQHPQPQPTAEQVASKWNIPQDAMDIIIPRTKI